MQEKIQVTIVQLGNFISNVYTPEEILTYEYLSYF